MRIGIGTNIGGVSLFASKSAHPGNAAWGCLVWFLKLAILPFWLLFLYIRWCIKNNSECDDVPIYMRPWAITTVALVVFMIFAGAIGGNASKEDANAATSSVSTVSQYSEPDGGNSALAVIPTATPEPTAEPTPEPTPEPTAAPTEELAPEPTQAPAPAQQQEMVWVPTNGGTKYHRTSDCSGMIDPIQVPLSQAQAQGFGPCGRCY